LLKQGRVSKKLLKNGTSHVRLEIYLNFTTIREQGFDHESFYRQNFDKSDHILVSIADGAREASSFGVLSTMIIYPKSVMVKFKDGTQYFTTRVTILKESAECYHMRYEEHIVWGGIRVISAGEVARRSKNKLKLLQDGWECKIK
jgi:hypothetical protein